MPALQDAGHILCNPAASAPYDDVLVGFQVEEPEASGVWFAGHENKIRTMCPNEKPAHATDHANNELQRRAAAGHRLAGGGLAAVAYNALVAFISFMW